MLPLNSHIKIGPTRYRTLRLLYTGPLFSIFHVHNENLRRDEALRISHTPEEDTLEDAVRLSRLGHPASVRLLSAGTLDLGGQRQVMLMELPDWKNLAETFDGQTMSALQACRILGHLLGALIEAHEAGLVYGNLNPTTVLIRQQVTEQVRIADFGVRAQQSEDLIEDPTHVFNNHPAYKAPEQLLGATPSPSGDLFSLGVLLYEFLSGTKPFALSGFGLIRAYQRGEKPEPLHEKANVPGELSAIIDRLLSIDESARFQSASEVASRLLCLDPDELLAFSPVPLAERSALNMSIPLAAPQSQPAATVLTTEPVIWVLKDDPAFRQPNTKALVERLASRHKVRVLTPEERPEVYSALVRSEIPAPWVILFGDLHIILGEPMLRVMSHRGDVSRVLVSTHLNAELMFSTINSCSLDQQLMSSAEVDEQVAAVERMVERTRRILTQSSTAELRLRSALDRIDALKQQLASTANKTNRLSRRNVL